MISRHSRRSVSYFANEAAAVNVTAGQQNIQAGEVAMQDIHTVQVCHAAGHLLGCCQNRRQVWEPMNSRPICAEPASVNPILSACTIGLHAMHCLA